MATEPCGAPEKEPPAAASERVRKMSRANGHDEHERHGSGQRGQDERTAGHRGTSQEAGDWARETGYRPNVNQRRREPMPASHHDERRQEAVLRNEEHAGTHAQARPSPRARRRGRGHG
jgi:hypothetical protein